MQLQRTPHRCDAVLNSAGFCLAQGAATVLYAATAPELKGRNVLYLHNMREAPASKMAQDSKLALQLWDASSMAVAWSARDEHLCRDEN